MELGANLHIGYFAQAHEGLHPELDLIAEIQTVAPNMLPGQVRDYLAKFLFTGDEVFKPVERALRRRARPAGAGEAWPCPAPTCCCWTSPPTTWTCRRRKCSRRCCPGMTGTILLVSHDRYLIDALATQVWEVDAQESVMRVFEGSYSEYRAAREAEKAAAEAHKAQEEAPSRPLEERPRPQKNVNNAERKRRAYLQGLENRIADLESQLAAISRQLESPPGEPGKVQRLGSEYVRIQGELDGLLTEWEALEEF